MRVLLVMRVSRSRYNASVVSAGGGALVPAFDQGAVAGTAGAPAQVDLSVSVNVSPEQFSPGGTSTVVLTVHNSGPDVAGATTPSPSVVVYGGDFDVTSQPPPYEVVVPAAGCGVERFISEPLPDGSINLVFVYYFDSIAAGQSRTCTFDIALDPSTHASFANDWQVTSLDSDVNPANNVLDYTFIDAPPPASSVTVPTLGTLGSLSLVFALVMGAVGARRRLGA